MRNAICCAIVPEGKKTAASAPSSAAIRSSNAASQTPLPYESKSTSRAPAASSANASAGATGNRCVSARGQAARSARESTAGPSVAAGEFPFRVAESSAAMHDRHP